MGIDLDAVPAEVAFTDTPAAALPGEPSHDAPHPLDDTIVGAAHELSPMASAVGVPEPVVSPLGDLELDEEIVLPGEGFDHASPPPALTSSSFSPRHQLEAWLAAMVQSRASDLILRAGGKPSCRVDGKIRFLPGRVPAAGALLEVLDGVVGLERMELWRESGSVDVAVHLDGLGRFRLNAYKQMGEPAVVLRRISDSPPLMENLGLPTSELKRLAGKKRGIVLVTGIAGSGKSTTLAAIIQYMNLHFERHIVTLEDPVEMMFTEDRCVISQREVGTDCPTFHEGLRHALRQSPDVILIGEMRDAETVNAALDATETGHLVLSTLHTVNAAQTVDRILSFFPAEQHAQARARLAENLGAVLSQRLIPRATGKGLVPAFELMTSSPHVRELLVEGRTSEISRVIDTSGEPGLISFNMSLRKLVESAWVDLEIALSASDRPDELMMALRGFQHGSEKRGNQGPSDGPASSLRMAE
jgi:twitching motility protein PilT